MNQAGCAFNLQQLGHSLAQYASIHPSYPYPPSHQPDAHAGTFAAFLHDAGVLQDLSILDCPYNGPCSPPATRPAQLRRARAAPPHRPERTASCSAGTTPTTSAIVTARAGRAPGISACRWPFPWSPTAAPTRTTPRSSTATAPITPAAARTCCTATAASAGTPTRRVSPHRRGPLPQQPARAAARPRRARLRSPAQLSPFHGSSAR